MDNRELNKVIADAAVRYDKEFEMRTHDQIVNDVLFKLQSAVSPELYGDVWIILQQTRQESYLDGLTMLYQKQFPDVSAEDIKEIVDGVYQEYLGKIVDDMKDIERKGKKASFKIIK